MPKQRGQTKDVILMRCACRDCGKVFEIDQGQLDWLRELGLEPWSRCQDCRAKRRSERGVV